MYNQQRNNILVCGWWFQLWDDHQRLYYQGGYKNKTKKAPISDVMCILVLAYSYGIMERSNYVTEADVIGRMHLYNQQTCSWIWDHI
jgi:hypothetical protein